MAYSKIEQAVWEMAEPIAKENGCYLYDVEYLKEGGISLDECELVSRALSEVLDEKDPIDRNYYLEVSSPGVERKLKTPEQFQRYLGETVDVGLYKAVKGAKLLTGTLTAYDGETVTLEVAGESVEIPQKETTVVHLHFDFS